jgi:hypothetical protein
MNSKSFTAVAVLTAAVMAAGPAQAGEVEVRFTDPQQFSDIGFGHVTRDRNLKTLSDHMAGWRSRLPEGQRLDIEVVDVDLAGMERPWGREPFVRILNGRVDGPRMHLRWSLSQGGTVLLKGEDQLSDLGYAQRLPTPQRNEPLYYDRRMLDEWLRKMLTERMVKPI